MTRTVVSPQVDVVASLTERCDRCGATGKLAIILGTGGSLTFCGHHANEHAEAITSTAERVSLVDDFYWYGSQQ